MRKWDSQPSDNLDEAPVTFQFDVYMKAPPRWLLLQRASLMVAYTAAILLNHTSPNPQK